MYYIGIDGGSAYSRLAAVGENGEVIGKHAGGSTNLKAYDYDIIKKNIQKLLLEFNRLTNTSIEDCAGLCIGSAIDNKHDEAAMLRLFEDIGLKCPVKAVNDAELALATETKGGPGIVVRSATDSLGYAVDSASRSHRSGGWGYLLDEGSGYHMGIEAIKYVMMAYDGRCEKTLLTEKIKDQLQLKSISEAAEYLHSDKFNQAEKSARIRIAELALSVKYAAQQNDSVACQLEANAAKALYLLAKALIQRLELYNNKLVICGNVIMLNESIQKQFSELVLNEFNKMEIIPLREKPEIGAVHLAMKLK